MKKSILFSKCAFIILFGLSIATQLNAQNAFPGLGTGAIPDGGGSTSCGVNGAPLDVTFNVTGLTDPITSIEVDITMTHTYIGDVTATLIAPDGVTSLVLFGRTGAASATACGNSYDLGGTYLFTDIAIGDNWWAANGTAGNYRTTEIGPQNPTTFSPVTSLNDTFGGMTNVNANGIWTLRFNDGGTGDTGAVSAANLMITTDCIVDIPDAAFKAYLIGNPAINTNGNTEIECDEAEAFTGAMYCSNLGITDLTGIEAFVNITLLDCYANLLTTLDVSDNTALQILYCHDNQLTTLNVSNNTALQILYCHDNQLTSLDVSNNTALNNLNCDRNQLTTLDVSNNTALTYLWCVSNQLTTLDVSNNTALIRLDCDYNQLATLDVSNNPVLIDLYCIDNQLTSLDVSNNTALKNLYCEGNQLTTLDVSNNTDLTYLWCVSNQLTTLDVSNNTALIRLDCDYNQLTSLNVQNGNNTNFTGFYADNNPNLLCIQVDDAAWSTANWTDIDNVASFSEDCSLSVNNSAALTTISVYPNPVTDMLYFSTSEAIKNVSIIDMLGKVVYQSNHNSPEVSINIAALQQAIYLTRITTESQIQTIKIIKK